MCRKGHRRSGLSRKGNLTIYVDVVIYHRENFMAERDENFERLFDDLWPDEDPNIPEEVTFGNLRAAGVKPEELPNKETAERYRKWLTTQ
jgi:hypothetical protein